MSIHYGISCDSCRKLNIVGRRYKCLICNDFDLCSICIENKSRIHSIHHPMQLIITSNDYENIYFGSSRTKYSSYSLTCPLCNKNGFNLNILIKHINEEHSRFIYSVLCPICFVRQNNLSQHLYQHIDENINKKLKVKESKSIHQSLLDKIINNYSNKNENQQRYLFIHSLLTNLFNENH